MFIQGTLKLIPGTRNNEMETLMLLQGTLKLLSPAYLQNIFCINAIAQQIENNFCLYYD
ncbi:hypothetical protein [Calothrix sp. NIES-2098]|uniref:hypothetical protein n=1 Tax=Calothrix sp. NIES-2098 TaxID=1954171 RepID=UPI000B5DCCDB|nr:hypothetical protein NIES2098_01060 [Calothrix sp. NIES-2098]